MFNFFIDRIGNDLDAVARQTEAALGLDRFGILTFDLSNEIGNNAGEVQGQTWSNSVKLNSLFYTTTRPGDVDGLIGVTIHEMGHIIDWNANSAPRNGDGWANRVGGEWRTSLVGHPNPISDRVGVHEDFAETFAWFVEQTNGVNYGDHRLASLENDDRRRLLDIALRVPAIQPR